MKIMYKENIKLFVKFQFVKGLGVFFEIIYGLVLDIPVFCVNEKVQGSFFHSIKSKNLREFALHVFFLTSFSDKNNKLFSLLFR